MVLIGSMHQFDVKSDEWILYQEQLEQFFDVNDIKDTETDKKRVAALLSLIGSDTYKILRDLCTPSLPKSKSYTELCKLLKAHFSPATCIFRERIDFYAAAQETNESLNKWYARIHNLATNCEFGTNLESILQDKFVCGLQKGKIRDRLCEEKPSAVTLEKLMEIALSKEATLLAVDKSVNWVKSNPFQRRQKVFQQSQAPSGNSVEKKTGKWKCNRCGNQHTGRQNCKYVSYKCNVCSKVGHLAKMCRSNKQSQNFVDIDENEVADVFNISFNNAKPVYVVVRINKVSITMQIDSGAAISILTENTYLQWFKNCELKLSSITLRDYSGNEIESLGVFKVTLEYECIKSDFVLHVVRNGRQNLLGRDFLQKFNFKLVSNILSIENNLDNLLNEFQELFNEGLGCYKHRVFKLRVTDDIHPIFMKPRPTPFIFKEKVEQELQRLEDEGVISPIETCDWGTPLVPVLKNDGSVRLCGDYKVTVNKAIINVRYPLPRIEDIFLKLNGGESFTKIDLSNAYNQLCLDEESSRLLAWSTHKGLFKVNRLPFGVTPASSIFQKTLEQTLQGLEGVANFIDDIIVTGKTRKEHEENLRATFSKLQEAGFKIKAKKCVFFQDEINYLGHTITKNGLKKNLDKVKAILEAPTPTNVTQIKSFAGLVNYYSKFAPKIASIMKPIYELLKKQNKFEWNQNCELAFRKIKEVISSNNVLTQFDPKLPIILSTDASQDGIAAALSHRMANGDIRPVLFISRTLSSSESNYSVLDKEGLAVIWSVKKLHHYLMGQTFTIQTDHRTLLALLGERSAIPPMASSRVHRWALYLSGFSYKIEYVKGADNKVADMLSRHPLQNNLNDAETGQDKCLNLIISEGLPIDSIRISIETRRDPILSKVFHYVMNGWPEASKDDIIKPYLLRRTEITCEQGCLLWGYRVIIPTKLRDQLLEELHASHLGIVKMKSIARSYFWWPKLDEMVENVAKSCRPCLMSSGDAQKSVVTPWFRPKKPGERIHIDFLGPVENRNYFILQDAFSKWPEICEMKSTTAEATVIKVREYCTRWGLPKTIVSDNGPQLVSSEFESFCKKNGIQHITIAPYHPATNGLAENAVKNFKKGLYASLKDPKNKSTPREILISRYLLAYRNSKHCTTNETPAYLMLGRNLRTAFDLLKPNTNACIEKKQINQSINTGKPIQQLQEGDSVIARDYRNINKKTWAEAKIVKILGNKTYICETEKEHLRWKRHIDQLKRIKIGEETSALKKEGEERNMKAENENGVVGKKIPSRVIEVSHEDRNRGDHHEQQRATAGAAAQATSGLSSNEPGSKSIEKFNVNPQSSNSNSLSTKESRLKRNTKPPTRFKEFVTNLT